MEHDIHSQMKAVPAFNRATINTATTTHGIAVDLAGYEGCEIVALTDTITAAGSGASLALYESDTGAFGGEQVLVTADKIRGGYPVIDQDADDNKAFRFGYTGKKRYVRPAVVSLSAFNGSLSMLAILGVPRNAPVADQNT